MWQMRLVGLMYCLSGLWCVYQPMLAASYLGFSLSNNGALVEFIAVYGGLQLGIGLGALSASFSQELVKGALWLLISISFSLFLFRLVALLRFNEFSNELLMMLVLELFILLLLLNQYLRIKVKAPNDPS